MEKNYRNSTRRYMSKKHETSCKKPDDYDSMPNHISNK